MEFTQPDIGRPDAGFGERGLGGAPAHVVADEVDGGAGEELRGVGCHGLAGDLDGVGAQVRARGEEVRGDEDGGGAAVGGGAALELGQGRVDGGGGEDLREGVGGAELGVGV